jgi:hypothetical protein
MLMLTSVCDTGAKPGSYRLDVRAMFSQFALLPSANRPAEVVPDEYLAGVLAEAVSDGKGGRMTRGAEVFLQPMRRPHVYRRGRMAKSLRIVSRLQERPGDGAGRRRRRHGSWLRAFSLGCGFLMSRFGTG